ncbi:hypothetical protein BC937DRAFT_88391 [Endogone sp. FLAS-F59071]|nr:hypothetical protein BC937DRAFT_88391 [Endogone sp. FLAS-F59071]|eukprot:RUS18749.1 hypothetical protein BC937DRAFT_88391 [Endogone sp. FLAS-F59071]
MRGQDSEFIECTEQTNYRPTLVLNRKQGDNLVSSADIPFHSGQVQVVEAQKSCDCNNCTKSFHNVAPVQPRLPPVSLLFKQLNLKNSLFQDTAIRPMTTTAIESKSSAAADCWHTTSEQLLKTTEPLRESASKIFSVSNLKSTVEPHKENSRYLLPSISNILSPEKPALLLDPGSANNLASYLSSSVAPNRKRSHEEELVPMEANHPNLENSNGSNNERVTRPPNAWILFRRDLNNELKSTEWGLRADDVSRRGSQRWRTMSTQAKQYWKDLSEKLKQQHQQLYPNYRYNPRRPKAVIGARKARKQTRVQREAETSGRRAMQRIIDMRMGVNPDNRTDIVGDKVAHTCLSERIVRNV